MITKAVVLLTLLTMPLISTAQRVVKPKFQGNLRQYINNNARYPRTAIDKDIEGECLIQFMIAKDGSITRVHQVKSSGDQLLDKEAERLIAAMPAWKPGTCKNEPATFMYQLPVSFRLQ